MMDQDEEDAAEDWVRSLCVRGRHTPVHNARKPRPPDGFDAERFSRGQRVAMDNIFSLAYAELVSMLMMFAFEDQTAVLVSTGKSDTPSKAYFRYLSTMRRVRSWYEGDLWDPESEAAKNLKAVRIMHDQVARRPTPLSPGKGGGTLHTQPAFMRQLNLAADHPPRRPSANPAELERTEGRAGSCPAASAARHDFAEARPAPAWAVWADESHDQPPAINQWSMAVTQMAFLGLFILEPARFGAHRATEADLDALVYVWWVLGHGLGMEDCFNVCYMAEKGDRCTRLRVARARCRAVLSACALPRLARVSARWHLMSSALCDGAALAAPGLSLPLALAYLVEVLGAVRPALRDRPDGQHAVEHLLQAHRGARAWRALYRLVLDSAMRYSAGRALHNALFRLSLWVSERVTRAAEHRAARALLFTLE